MMYTMVEPQSCTKEVKMKKILSVTLVVAFLVVFVTGCANENQQQIDTSETRIEQEVEQENIVVEKLDRTHENIDKNEIKEKIENHDIDEKPEFKREAMLEDK